MGLVNPPEVTPSVMHAICRYFAFGGESHTVDRSELEALLQSPSHPDGATQGRAGPVKATVDAAIELGILAASGTDHTTVSCRLPFPAVPLLDPAFDRAVVASLRRQVLSAENTGALFAAGRETQDTTRSREFARIATWVLLQDPTGPGLGYDTPQAAENVEDRQQAQCLTDLGPVVNDARWNSFRRWARYLGLVRTSPENRLLPDPTTAVGDELDAIYAGTSDLPVDEFVRQVGQRLPILDDGDCQAQVIAKVLKSDPLQELTGDRPVSRALSFALRRLARNDAIRLDNRGDAPRFRNLGNTVITHVVRLSA